MPLTIRYVCLGALLITCIYSQAASQLYLDSFDYIWKTISEKHWDPKFKGVDWQAARDELRPRILASSTPGQARMYLETLLERLGHSHVGIIPAEAYQDLESSRTNGYAGIKFEIIGGEAILSNTIHAGSILREVNGRKVGDRISRSASGLHKMIAVRNMLRGAVGETLNLLLENEQGKLTLAKLELGTPPGRLVQFGYLPPIHLELHFEKLSSECGYIRISSFFDPEGIQELLQQATTQCTACRGMILDLRDNAGGIGGLAAAVTGWFINKPVTLGTCIFRQAILKLIANPRPNPFLGKLAILTNGRSMSTSEFLAGGLKDLGRARIFGQPTPGAALPSSIEKLPTGDGFQYSTADYISAGGKHLEGIGVEPDILISPTRKQLLERTDAALKAAQFWIEKEQ